MKIVSVSENRKIEKRIAITPDVAKKYINLGFKISLPENYASHLGINDTIKVCIAAWKMNKCRHYSITHKKSYSILQITKMFKSRITMLKSRPGERYASALTRFSQNNRIIKKYGKINLKDYISSFIKE